MPKSYNARNTASTGGKAHGPKQPRCATCADKRQVRVSKRRNPQGVDPRQQYDIVWEKCPDC